MKLHTLKEIIEQNPDNPRLKEIIYNNSANKIINLLRSKPNQKLKNKNQTKMFENKNIIISHQNSIKNNNYIYLGGKIL